MVKQGEPLLQNGGGQPRRLGQVGHVVPEIAVLIQAGGQELGPPEDDGGGVAPLQLPRQMEQQGVGQPPVRSHPGQGVQLIPVGGDVLPVLVVQIRQGLQAPPQLLALIPRVGRLGQLGGRLSFSVCFSDNSRFMAAPPIRKNPPAAHGWRRRFLHKSDKNSIA